MITLSSTIFMCLCDLYFWPFLFLSYIQSVDRKHRKALSARIDYLIHTSEKSHDTVNSAEEICLVSIIRNHLLTVDFQTATLICFKNNFRKA